MSQFTNKKFKWPLQTLEMNIISIRSEIQKQSFCMQEFFKYLNFNYLQEDESDCLLALVNWTLRIILLI